MTKIFYNLLKWTVRILLKLCFRLEPFGLEHLKTPGPALLLPNHLSWIDWLFIEAFLDNDWRFVTSKTTAERSAVHRFVMLNGRTFPIDPASPYAVKQMTEFLKNGGRLVLFAEGRMSSTGCLMKIFEGAEFLIERTRPKIIMAYMKGVNRQTFSTMPGKKVFFPKIHIVFRPVALPEIEQAPSEAEWEPQKTCLPHLWLEDQFRILQFDAEMELGPDTLPQAILETARFFPEKLIMEDLTLSRVTYRKFLLGVNLLRAPVSKALSAEKTRDPVGILLPNVNAHPILMTCLWTLRKTPALLNYTQSVPAQLACAEISGIKSIFTSRSFLEKAALDISPFEEKGIRIIYMEDLKKQISGIAKLIGWFINQIHLGIPKHPEATTEDTAVILFTSGSEGVPKGVELTHRNLLANVRQALSAIDIEDRDRMLNALPLFHSFGMTVGTLLPLIRGIYTFYYPSPLHYRMVPIAAYNTDATILLGANTFLKGYARKAHPYEFHRIRFIFAGAEKLHNSTFHLYAEKFGVRILQGYGATELSPAVSINTRMNHKLGSTGRLLPHMEARLEPEAGVDVGGRLWLRGPNVMKGYINPDANAKFLEGNGWYDTGDIAEIDSEGYLYIRGRLKRFAKVSGEMISLTSVEDSIAEVIEALPKPPDVAVISVPCDDRGEKLVLMTDSKDLDLGALRKSLQERKVSPLWIPKEMRVVDEIPKLGTGKINYPALNALAEKYSSADS